MKTIEIPSEGDILIKVTLYDLEDVKFGRYVIERYRVTECEPYKTSFQAVCLDKDNKESLKFYFEDEGKPNYSDRNPNVWFFPEKHNVQGMLKGIINYFQKHLNIVENELAQKQSELIQKRAAFDSLMTNVLDSLNKMTIGENIENN